jgi:hypothetical protein
MERRHVRGTDVFKVEGRRDTEKLSYLKRK